MKRKEKLEHGELGEIEREVTCASSYAAVNTAEAIHHLLSLDFTRNKGHNKPISLERFH